MTKLDDLKKWLRKRKYVSTVQIEDWGMTYGYLSAMRRARELAEPDVNFLRPIPNDEAKEKSLVKKGNRPIRWYEVKHDTRRNTKNHK